MPTTIEAVIGIIASIVGIILTIAIIHYTFVNKSKTKSDNIKILWERIDALEVKLETEITKREGIIAMMQKRIDLLTQRLRDYGIPVPSEAEELITQPLKKTRGLTMKQ